MGGGGGGGGGKRSVNSELNLVPYIDLLSTLICFLLITAVWQQISALSTNGQNTSTSDSATPPPPDPNRVDFTLSVFLDRMEAQEGKKTVTIRHIGGEPDYQGLLRTLMDWRSRYPDRKDLTLNTDSQAPYKNLIRVMDTLFEVDFNDVGVNTK